MVTSQRVSVAEYLALPDDAKPYLEYIDGKVVPKPVPDDRHGELVEEYIYQFGPYKRENGWRGGPEIRSEFEWIAGHEFRLPDISYWAPGKLRRAQHAVVPPTVAVEVRSPGQTMSAARERCRFFRQHGVELCILVDPDSRTVELFDDEVEGRRLGTGDVLLSRVMPGFRLDLRSFFAVLDNSP